MYGGNNTNKCKISKFNTCKRYIKYIYAEQKIQEIFPMIGGKGEKCQLSVRLVWKQVGLSVYRSYVTYVSDSIQ